MAKDPALRWLLDNDPAAAAVPSTLAYLRAIGCGNPIGQPKTEHAVADHALERRDHCRRCRAAYDAGRRRVA